MKIESVMTRDVKVVPPDASIQMAAQLMDQLNVGALPVCNGDRLIGMITDRDITIRATAAGLAPADTRVEDAMSGDVHWCYAGDEVDELVRTMGDVQIRRVPVVDDDKRLVGIVSLGDRAEARVDGAERALRRLPAPAEPSR